MQKSGFLLQRNTSYTVFSVAQHMYVNIVSSSTFIIHMRMSPVVLNQVTSEWIVLNLNASCHVTSGCLVLPLNASCDLESSHLWLCHVTVLYVIQRTYSWMEKPLRVSYISTVLASLVSSGLTPTLHLKFCRIFFCQLVDSNGYRPSAFGVLTVHLVTLRS